MKAMIVDIYRLTDKELIENELYYKNRVKFYNFDLKKLEDCALRDEEVNNYYIGQIIEF